MTGQGDPAPTPPWSSAPAWSQPDEPAAFDGAVAHASGGRYALRELLGRGGMGEVWVARDNLLGRDVALKRVRAGASAQELLREAQLAALLEHPGIVPVHDAVVLPDGDAWCVMRLVRGRNLAQTLADLPSELPAQVEARCKLVAHIVDACRAVAFAHRVGVLHRDLKSDNLLIGELGDTQVADWGLAGLAAQAEAGATGSPLGCPAYLSPQRANGAAATAQDDLFALGAVLYEVVSGAPPFADRDVQGQWRRARMGDRGQPTAIWSHMPNELCAIATKATEPDSAARYTGVADLCADLERWSSGRRVHAHTYSPLELTRRFVSAFRLPLAVAAVALLLVIALVAHGVRRIAGERDQAQAARRAEAQAHGVAQFQLAETLAMQASALAQTGDRPAAEVSAARSLRRYNHPVARGVLAGFGLQPRPESVAVALPWPCNHTKVAANGDCVACLSEEEVQWQCGQRRGRLAGPPHDIALFAALERVAITQPATLTVASLDGEVERQAALPAGRIRLLSADNGATGAVIENSAAWAFEPLTMAAGPRVHCAQTRLLAAALHPNGRRLAGVCAGGTLVVADATAPSAFAAPWVDRMRGVVDLALPSDHTAVALGIDGSLAVIDASTGELRALWRAGGVTELAALQVSPPATVAAVLGAVGGVAWVRLADGAMLSRAPAQGVRYLQPLAGGGIVASGQQVAGWRPHNPPRPVVLEAGAGLTSVDGSPDRQWLAAGAGTGELLVWSLPDGVVALRAQVCGNTVKDVQFAASGTSLLVACIGAPGLVRLTHAAGQWLPPTSVNAVESRRAGALASGRIWVTESVLGLRVLRGTTVEHHLRGPGFAEGDCTAGAGRAFVVGPRGGVWQIDDNGTAPVERWPRAAAVAVGASANGEVVAMASAATVVVVDVSHGRARSLTAVQSGVQDLAVSADGSLIAVAHIDGSITVLNESTQGPRLLGHRQRTVAVRFLPGGEALASASWDGTVRLWSVRSLVERAETLAAEADATWK